MIAYQFRPMERAVALQIAQWRYAPPYDIYNASEVEEAADEYLTPEYHYYSLWQNDDLVAFRCFGPDARVHGGDYSADALDLGGGMRPDLTGKGLGASVMQASFEFAKKKFNPSAFRCTVAGFNLRAQKVCLKVGYQEIQRFTHPNNAKEFVVFLRSID